MALKDTIELDVNVGEGVKSLTNLKAEFKTLQKQLDGLDESSQEYIETLQKLGSVKDDIGDLSTAINDFAGTDAKIGAINSVVGGIASGFQAATGAAALFGSQSEDVEKALLKVQSVMALTEGIKGLTAMQDSLKAAGNVAKSLVTQLIGVDAYTKIVTVSTRIWNAVMAANPIMLMVAAVTALVGAAVLLAKAFDDNVSVTEKYIEANNRAIEQSKETVKSIDNEITALSGLAANEEKIIELKRKRIVETIKQAQLDALNAQAQAAKDKELSWWQEVGVAVNELNGIEGTRAANQNKNSEESNKKLKENIDLVKKSAAELQAFDNEQKQKKIDTDKAASDKAKQDAEKRKQAQKEQDDYNAKRLKDEQDAEQLAADYLEQQEQEKRDKKQKADEESARIRMELDQQEADNKERLRLEAEEADKLDKEKLKQAEEKSIDALQGISQAYFAHKLRSAKGNQVETLKIQKRQFEVEKAFSVARSIQDGIRSVTGALANTATLGPGAIALAAVNGTIAAANVAKLLATSFEGGGSADVGGGNIASPGTFTQAPSVGGGSSNNQTQLNSDGSVNKQSQPSVLKAYVVESESAAVTKRVNKLENQSKIG